MLGPPSDEVGGRCSESSGGGLVLGQEPFGGGITAGTTTKKDKESTQVLSVGNGNI